MPHKRSSLARQARAIARQREYEEQAKTRDIHSKVRGVYRALPPAVAHLSVILENAAIRNSHAEIDETRETHVIPRKSVTVSQFLEVRKPQLELEVMHARQLDRKSGTFTAHDPCVGPFLDYVKAHGRMIETTDNRLLWKSDKSLLNKDMPGQKIGTFKRDGSIRKGLNSQRIRVTENEDARKIVDEIIGDFVEVIEEIPSE